MIFLLELILIVVILYFIRKPLAFIFSPFKKLQNFFKKEDKKPVTKFNVDITSMKKIGELSVYQIKNRVNVFQDRLAFQNHPHLSKLFSDKKVGINFDFELDFIYDLKNPDFSMQETSDKHYLVQMPTCEYKYNIKNLQIYSEENARFMPSILPGFMSKMIGTKFTEAEKTELINQALESNKASLLKDVERLKNEIQTSATDTINALANSFGGIDTKVTLEFNDKELLNADATVYNFIEDQNKGDELSKVIEAKEIKS